MPNCPCCGTPLNAPAIIARLPLSKRERRFVGVLAAHMEDWFSLTEAINAVYFDSPNGGPVNADDVIRQLCHKLGKTLATTPLVIESKRGQRRLTWRQNE